MNSSEHDLPTRREGMATVSMSREFGGEGLASTGSMEPAMPHRIGRFVVIEEIGRGGMGVVFSAYDPQLDRRVALKLLRGRRGDGGEGRARMFREAQSMAKLSHPNVVTIYDVGIVEDAVFLAMELVSGRTLRSWLRDLPSEGRWPQAAAMLRQAGQGLAAAHRAGLVHRDFKPDNVLVDEGGRARVLDFGLARANRPSYPEESSIGDDRTIDTLDDGEIFVTEAGYVVGTPGYMPPAQLRGETVDALGDQFSFCVVLYEALYGKRPFVAQTPEEYLEVMREEPVPAESYDVPPWLHRVVMRGLSFEPAERYPDMEALLSELAPANSRWWRRFGSGVAGLVVGLSAWAYHANTREPVAAAAPDPCAGAERRLVGIWDDERRGTIRRAFAQTDLEHATPTWEHVDARLGALTTRWVDAQRTICTATHVEQRQSAALMAIRQSCLETRLSEVRAHTMVMSRPEAGVVDSAVEAVDRLRDPTECQTVETMQVERPLPAEADQAAAVVQLRQRLDDVDALTEAGQVDEAIEQIEQIEADAEALEFLPVVAEAGMRHGVLYDGLGDYDRAAQVLLDALWAAEVGRHDAAAVDIWMAWIRVVGYHQQQYERVEPMLPRLDAALRRLGSDLRREAKVNRVLGTLAFSRSDYDGAYAYFREAAAISERVLGLDHVDTGTCYQNLGTALYRLDRLDESSTMLRKAETIWTTQLGAMHPKMGTLHMSMGTLAMKRNDYEQAVGHYRRSVEIYEELHPPGHPDFVVLLRNLADALLSAGRRDEGMTVLERARSIEEQHDFPRGSTTPTTMLLGRALVDAGRYAEAIELLEPAVEDLGDPPDPTSDTREIRGLFDLARAQWESLPDRRAQAEALARSVPPLLGERGRKLVQEVERWLEQRGATVED